MRKVAAIVLVAASVFVFAAVASATPPVDGPPGQGECDHGNSGQTCVPDPQPTHGQDCEEHGNEGGVNEDHCLGETTSTTVATAPPETTTTSTVTSGTTPTTTAPPETTTTSGTTGPPTPFVEPTTTTITPTCAEPEVQGTCQLPGASATSTTSPTKPKDPTSVAKVEKPGSLAFTGVENVVPLGAMALALASLGSGLLWVGRRKRDAE